MNNNNFLSNIGLRISGRRKELNITQEKLAERMGVSLQTISCIELGKKAIRPENLANLCLHLNVSADYVLYGKRDEQQMNDIVSKLSTLSPEEYNIVENLVTFFSNKK